MANDLGTQFLSILFTTEAGIFLIGVLLAAMVKYFWKSQLANQLRDQFESRKYVIYFLFAGMGLVLWFLGINDIVNAVGIAIIGIGVSTFLFDAWEDYLKPFVKTNTSKVIIMGIGVLLILFNGSIESVFGFPSLLTAIFGIIMIVGMWFPTLSNGYQKMSEKYPSLSVKNMLRR
ncbi:MAG: hypothetical protein ACXAC8_17675 [Candidatus Hodarchaeales archaeon]|jgi:hypothetical protein